MPTQMAYNFATPASRGLTMYFSPVPHHLRSHQLPLPLYKPNRNTHGPYEYRPAGDFTKFVLHCDPVEQLVARWRRGDLRAAIRGMGTPTAGTTRAEGQAMLAERSSEDWAALVAFQLEVAAQVEVLRPLYVFRRRQLREGGELFAALAFAAVQDLGWEVHNYCKSWEALEAKVAHEPLTLTSVVVGLKSSFSYIFGGASASSSLARTSVRKTPDISTGLSFVQAAPTFNSGARSALSQLACVGRRSSLPLDEKSSPF